MAKYIEKYQDENLNYCGTLLYYFMAKELTDRLGIDGEKSVRQGLRDYAADRGRCLREKHKKYGMKLNVKNFHNFSDHMCYDAPRHDDEGGQITVYKMTESEGVHIDSFCPSADLWISLGARRLGEMLCEESHIANYQAYMPECQVNLSPTLTQEGGKLCSFHVFLRAANLSDERRKESFPEFDPDFKGDRSAEYELVSCREAWADKCIKMIYWFAKAVQEHHGEKGMVVLGESLEKFALDLADHLRKSAAENGKAFDRDFVYGNSQFSFTLEEDPIWKNYMDGGIPEFTTKHFYEVFAKAAQS